MENQIDVYQGNDGLGKGAEKAGGRSVLPPELSRCNWPAQDPKFITVKKIPGQRITGGLRPGHRGHDKHIPGRNPPCRWQ